MEMRSLFGGAITCEFPSSYEDVSYVREIPDNEEVFQETSTDSSLIVEILEYQTDVSDEQIASFHFNTIAEENGVQRSQIELAGVLERPGEMFKRVFWCSGIQYGIVKFREADPIGNDVIVMVGVMRLPNYNAELVISVNAPLVLSQTSSSAMHGSVPSVGRGKEVFERALATISLKDPSLFT